MLVIFAISGVVVLIVLVTITVIIISIYNSLILLKNNIDKAWANIDVLLKQRHDELIKLMASVKGYTEFEERVLKEVTEARTAFLNAKTIEQKAQASNIMEGALKSLFAVSESYPQLKSSEVFMQFQTRISEIENQIADRREFYNDSVNTYNIRIEQIPDVFVARFLALSKKEMFKVTESDRQDVQVSF